MYSCSCVLKKIEFEQNDIGVLKEKITQREVPIIKIESIFANEFYKAHEVGFKPKLRLRLSNLSYEDETELIYQNETYTIIRTQNKSFDEIILICEKKVKNIEQ